MEKTYPWANRPIWMAMLILCLTSLNHLVAQEEPAGLQTNLKDLEVGGEWIYDDLNQGIALAKESGKPLFVLFR